MSFSFRTTIPPRNPVRIDGVEQTYDTYITIARGKRGWQAFARRGGEAPQRRAGDAGQPIRRGAVIEVLSADPPRRVMQRIVTEEGPE